MPPPFASISIATALISLQVQAPTGLFLVVVVLWAILPEQPQDDVLPESLVRSPGFAGRTLPSSTIPEMKNAIWAGMFLSQIAALYCGTSFGQESNKQVDSLVPTNIHQLFLDDQKDRNGDHTVAPYGNDVTIRDAKRRAETKALISAGKLKTARDFHDAAYIFQHGDEANDYLLAHILSVEAVVKGDATSKWIAAASLDRYLQAIGKGQVFGTQYLDKSFLYVMQHKDEPNLGDRPEANEKGKTQEPYERDLVPDSLRNDFCVPHLAQQKINLQEFESGRYPSGIIPPGCIR